MHLSRFSNVAGRPVKDTSVVDACVDNLLVHVAVDEVVSSALQYRLLATVNHSGTLERGHYTAYVRDTVSNDWWFCNDKAVIRASVANLSNSNSTLFFFERSSP